MLKLKSRIQKNLILHFSFNSYDGGIGHDVLLKMQNVVLLIQARTPDEEDSYYLIKHIVTKTHYDYAFLKEYGYPFLKNLTEGWGVLSLHHVKIDNVINVDVISVGFSVTKETDPKISDADWKIFNPDGVRQLIE